MTLGTVAITGGHGFLGWHLACQLRAVDGIEPHRWGRAELRSPDLADSIAGVDTIFHTAGVNRADTADAVEQGNIEAAHLIGDAVKAAGRPVRIVFSNSTQADGDSPYGRGKRAAAEILRDAAAAVGGWATDVLLPNLFGEHGRPSYNSFVATFADAIAHGRSPVVEQDREIGLLHAQRAAEILRSAALAGAQTTMRPQGSPLAISSVLERFRHFHSLYDVRGEVPDLSDDLDVDLFNTYRSYAFPRFFPIRSTVHEDQRGRLFETARVHGGGGQSFMSTTVPGATRGDHYHLRKVERFFVVQGTARIAMRRLLHDEVVTFDLSGSQPSFVDMPTLWTHNITNIGGDELVTMFWSNQLLEPDNPDQYPEPVTVAAL